MACSFPVDVPGILLHRVHLDPAPVFQPPEEAALAARVAGDAVLKKIGEEATETILAAKSGDRLHLVRETADLWFHCLIMLARQGLGPGDVLAELHRREGISGIDEKAARKAKSRGEEG